MLVTALALHIGYEKSVEIAKQGDRQGLTLREAAVESGYLTKDQFDTWVVPQNMI